MRNLIVGILMVMVMLHGGGYSLDQSIGPTLVQVWFDNVPSQNTLHPYTAYTFGVAVNVISLYSHGSPSTVWVTNLHWDFGDGSKLDVAFSTDYINN